MAPAAQRTSRAQRRRRTLRAPGAAPVIDLTNNDLADLDDLEKRRRAVLEQLGTAAAVVDLTREDSPPVLLKLEDIAVRPLSFTSECNACNNTRSYTLTIDGWKDDGDGGMLSGLVDVHSVTKLVLQPAIGYPVHFPLRPDGRGFLAGTPTYEHYGDDGDDGPAISLGLEEMALMIQEPWTERGFVAHVGLAK